MTLLVIDTAANLCAACVYDDRELGRAVRDIGKGHAEQLIPVIEEAMADARREFADLTGIAVTVGPGSFTGIRVGVSAARGFALALKIPAIRLTTLEGLAAEARQLHGDRSVLAALDAGRGELHAALYGPHGEELVAPAVLSLEQAAELSRRHRPVLAGTGAEMIRDAASRSPPEQSMHASVRAGGVGDRELAAIGRDFVDTEPASSASGPAEERATLEIASRAATADIGVYARLASAKRGSSAKPVPLYLRAPDARPQSGFVLPRRQA